MLFSLNSVTHSVHHSRQQTYSVLSAIQSVSTLPNIVFSTHCIGFQIYFKFLKAWRPSIFDFFFVNLKFLIQQHVGHVHDVLVLSCGAASRLLLFGLRHVSFCSLFPGLG